MVEKFKLWIDQNQIKGLNYKTFLIKACATICTCNTASEPLYYILLTLLLQMYKGAQADLFTLVKAFENVYSLCFLAQAAENKNRDAFLYMLSLIQDKKHGGVRSSSMN